MDRRIQTRTRVRGGLCLIALALLGLQIGCQTGPMKSLRGARHYASGNTALERSDGARAVREFERAADLVPLASEIQNHLGLAYWMQGREADARSAFERALELDCENEAARANLEQAMAADRPSSRIDSQSPGGEGVGTDGG